MKKFYLTFGAATVLLISACVKDVKQAESPVIETENSTLSGIGAEKKAGEDYVADEILVKFKKGLNDNLRAKLLEKISGSMKEKVLTKMMERFGDADGFYVAKTNKKVWEAIQLLQGDEGVEYAEPNYIYTHGAVSNDSYFTNGSLWGMYGDASSPANQYGSQAAEAWANNKTGSPSVIVGVIDEGVMHTHEDLKDNIWINPYDPVDGIDNDGNGYKDDKWGWDFVGNNNSTYDNTSDDHGSHVAGTIGAKGANGKGVAGVCWNVKIITAKFLGSFGGTTANAIKAIDYITDLKIRHGLNIVATNNSWGGGGFSQALQDAIERANARNILFVAAAGNGGSDGVGDDNDGSSKHYPSSYPNDNIIAVASITSSGAISSFSNFGSTSVDIGAPGSGIYSTLPSKRGNSYGSYSGTSMATPHVTGAAALYAASNTGATAAQIKSAILNSAEATPSLAGKCVTGGRLNVSGF